MLKSSGLATRVASVRLWHVVGRSGFKKNTVMRRYIRMGSIDMANEWNLGGQVSFVNANHGREANRGNVSKSRFLPTTGYPVTSLLCGTFIDFGNPVEPDECIIIAARVS